MMRTAVASVPAMARKTSPGFAVSPPACSNPKAEEVWRRKCDDSSVTCVWFRLPADERELLRLSPEIRAIGERLSLLPALSARCRALRCRIAAARLPKHNGSQRL